MKNFDSISSHSNRIWLWYNRNRISHYAPLIFSSFSYAWMNESDHWLYRKSCVGILSRHQSPEAQAIFCGTCLFSISLHFACAILQNYPCEFFKRQEKSLCFLERPCRCSPRFSENPCHFADLLIDSRVYFIKERERERKRKRAHFRNYF